MTVDYSYHQQREEFSHFIRKTIKNVKSSRYVSAKCIIKGLSREVVLYDSFLWLSTTHNCDEMGARGEKIRK